MYYTLTSYIPTEKSIFTPENVIIPIDEEKLTFDLPLYDPNLKPKKYDYYAYSVGGNKDVPIVPFLFTSLTTIKAYLKEYKIKASIEKVIGSNVKTLDEQLDEM